MEGAMRRSTEFCRCAARTLAPGSAAALEHPPTVYLRVDQLSRRVNDWIAELFSPEHIDSTVEELAAVVDEGGPAERAEADFKRRVAAAEAAMSRLRRALEAGWDPAELTAQYNAAAAEKRAAEAGLATIEHPPRLTPKEIRSMVDQLGDIGQVLDRANPKDLAELYDGLRLAVDYDHRTRVADVSIMPTPRVDSVCVRGGTRTLTTRLDLTA
jgi:hypothetical protein